MFWKGGRKVQAPGSIHFQGSRRATGKWGTKLQAEEDFSVWSRAMNPLERECWYC